MENTLYIPTEYNLENYHRSNQDTCLVHRPIIKEGNWVQPGDILADCSSSKNGELSIGQNILIAYMPWEGYNYEDAMLISERLVYDDIYTSIHIERYDIAIEETPIGFEKITNEIPDLPAESLIQLDKNGIIFLGSAVKEGDILVGKITPTDKKVKYSNYEKLLYDILGTKKQNKGKDTSLRVPKGLEATVINIEVFSENISFSLTNLNQFSLPNPLIYIQKGVLKFLKLQTKKHLRSSNIFSENKNKYFKLKSKLYFFEFIQRIIMSKRFKISEDSYSKKKLLIALHTIKYILIPRSYYSISGTQRISNSKLISKILNPTNRIERMKNKKKINIPKVLSKQNFDKLKLQCGFSFFEKFLFQILICAKNEKNGFLIKKIINSVSKNSALLYSKNLKKSIVKNSNIFYNKNVPFIVKYLPTKFNFIQLRKKRTKKIYYLNKKEFELKKEKLIKKSDNISSSLNFFNSNSFTIQIYLAEKRKIQVGDKIAGRHGNKGIVSQILPIQDMPYLSDGSAMDLVLNPLGVPSRMNVGQIYECLLGLSGYYLEEYYRILPFDEKVGQEASRSFVFSKLYEARLKTGYSWLFHPKNPGKTFLFDGRTGDKFQQEVTVGYAYILKLVHLVDDKIHSRSTGPYSAVTQQPLRGRSKQGGQRLGEMEVWALEGYGAAFTLLELLTIKSDDKIGRLTIWDSILRQKEISIKTPESFKVLICELKALCFDINILKKNK